MQMAFSDRVRLRNSNCTAADAESGPIPVLWRACAKAGSENALFAIGNGQPGYNDSDVELGSVTTTNARADHRWVGPDHVWVCPDPAILRSDPIIAELDPTIDIKPKQSAGPKRSS